MAISMLYEDFSTQIDDQTHGRADESPMGNQPGKVDRAGFEDGYKEGWIDAQAAAQNESSELSSEIATALQEAGFAYFEARQHIFNSMRPLLEAMVEQVLPTLAKDALPMKIVEEIEKFAETSEPPMHILCSPQTAGPLSDVLARHVSFPIEVKTEETLTESQAVLKFTEGESTIDLEAVVENMKAAVSDFYDLNQNQKVAHA